MDHLISLDCLDVYEDSIHYTTIDGKPIDESILQNIQEAILHHSYANGHGVILYGWAEIVAGAFAGCSNLKSIVIPEGTTVLGKYAFDNCI